MYGAPREASFFGYGSKIQQNPKENISCTVKKSSHKRNVITVDNVYQVLSTGLAQCWALGRYYIYSFI